jgi:DNA repair and recombination protein RAD52
MTFSDEQKQMLGAGLSSSHVKERKQGGRQLSYIEGWVAIKEANRIFGFDGWTRETLVVERVVEQAREIGENKVPGWGVTYICKVRVRAGDIVRDGCGSGHGIDRDLGLAHESALKEAETDAMKRALMTYGNPFGLALYDKQQADVIDEPPPPPAPTAAQIAAREAYIRGCEGTIASFTDKAKLSAWWTSAQQKEARKKYDISPGQHELLKAKVIAKGEALDVNS